MLQVKAFSGTRLYPENTQAQGYSNIGGNLYFRKPIGDLAANELALWHNQRVDKTLEEIEPQLRSQPLYALAEEGVFATNSSGARIPRFRIELIQALAAKSPELISHESLEARIMKENGGDFTSQEYNAMAAALYEGIARAASQVADEKKEQMPSSLRRWLSGETENPAETIKSWLTGKTLAPDSYEMFDYLSKATGSKTFREWHGQSNDTAALSTGFWKDYQFYVIFRQDAGNYLTKGKPAIRKLVQGKADSKRQPKSGFGGLHNAVMSAFSQLVGEFNDDYSPVKVEGVERIKVERGSVGQREEESSGLPKPAKGLYTGEPVKGMSVLSLADLVNQQDFFRYLVGIATENYLDGLASGQYASTPVADEMAKAYKRLTQGSKHLESLFGAQISWYAMQKAGLISDAERFGVPVAIKNNLTGKESRDMSRVIDAMGTFIADALVSGEMDRAFGLSQEPGKHSLTYLLFERDARITAALPQAYAELLNSTFTYNNLPKGAPRNLRKELEQDMANAKDALRKKYGLEEEQAGKCFILEDLYGAIWNYYQEQSKLPQQAGSGQLSWGKPTPAAARRLTEDEAMAYVISNSTREISYVLDPEKTMSNPFAQLHWQKHSGRYYTSQEAQGLLAMHGMPELFSLIPKANFAFETEAEAVRKQ